MRLWLGLLGFHEVDEVTLDIWMSGISPPVILADLLRQGFCALDLNGAICFPPN